MPGFKLTPLWQIQEKMEREKLRAALGPVMGDAVIKCQDEIKKGKVSRLEHPNFFSIVFSKKLESIRVQRKVNL